MARHDSGQTRWQRLGSLALALVLVLLFRSVAIEVALATPSDDAQRPDVTPPNTAESTGESQSPQPKSSADLPWLKKNSLKSPLPVIRPPTGVREILERYDLGESQLEGFFNGQPLGVAEEEMIVRILYRLPRIDLANIHKWRKPEADLTLLMANAAEHRLEVIPLAGRLVAVEKREVTPELAARLELKHFYFARVDLTDKGFQALVALRRVPQIWEDAAEDLDEPVSFDGIFLKFGGGSIDEPQLVFVAPRLRWHPEHEIPEQFIGPDQLRLAELGLDLSLLETLRQLNKKEIGDLDREPMYQLLDVVGQAPNAKLISKPRKELDLVPLLTEPEKHQGELMSVEGFAQRITKVIVDDADIRARFGIDHYYIIDMFVNLGDKTIKFVDDRKGKGTGAAKTPQNQADATAGQEDDGPVFNNDYPVTLCVRELPEDLPPKDAMRDLIRADGVFMKTWSYRNNKMSQFDNKLQVSPLLIAKTAHRITPVKPYNWVSDALVGFAIVAALFIIGSIFWWFRGTENQRDGRGAADADAAPPSFAGLEDVPTKPDFSSLQNDDRG